MLFELPFQEAFEALFGRAQAMTAGGLDLRYHWLVDQKRQCLDPETSRALNQQLHFLQFMRVHFESICAQCQVEDVPVMVINRHQWLWWLRPIIQEALGPQPYLHQVTLHLTTSLLYKRLYTPMAMMSHAQVLHRKENPTISLDQPFDNSTSQQNPIPMQLNRAGMAFDRQTASVSLKALMDELIEESQNNKNATAHPSSQTGRLP